MYKKARKYVMFLFFNHASCNLQISWDHQYQYHDADGSCDHRQYHLLLLLLLYIYNAPCIRSNVLQDNAK